MTRASRWFARHQPFTLLGWLLSGGSVYLLGTGFADGNAYAFLLSTVGFALLVVLGMLTRLEARRARGFSFTWESIAPVVAGQSLKSQRLANSGFRSLPFFRVHLIISGRYTAGRASRVRIRRDLSYLHEPNVPFGLRFPLSGTLHARYYTETRDVFGLTRARFGADGEKVVTVRPAFVVDRRPPDIDAQQGDEDQNRMKSSDVERYFMREYIPGDRERDINWKASSRYEQLFTRISPVTQEKTQQITVFFRPFNSRPRDSLDAMALLDRTKSMLLFFLRSVRSIHPEYEFRLFIGHDPIELESEDDIEQLAATIAGVHFRGFAGTPEISPDDLSGGAYVFTTACDTGLPEFLGQCKGDAMTVFRTVGADRRSDDDRVTLRCFDSLDSMLPGMLLLPRERRSGTAPGHAIEGSLTDEPVEVRLA